MDSPVDQSQHHDTAASDPQASVAQQAFLLRLADALRPFADPLEVQAEAARLLGEHLAADRVLYGEVEGADDGTFVIRQDFRRGDMPSAVGRYRFGDFGAHVVQTMRAGRTRMAADVRAEPEYDPANLAAYAALAIRAYVAVPLVKDGRIAAYLAAHQRSPRQWTAHEVALIEDVAERTWAAVERARAEAALRDSEMRFRRIVESARDYAIFVTDAQRRITDWLPGAAAVFGWSPEEAVGQSTDITYVPEDREHGTPEQEFDSARREAVAPDVRWHLRKDGRRVFIDGRNNALYDQDGSLRGFLKIGQDVTERRHAEERLRASEERLRSVLRISTVGVMFWGDGFGLTDMNDAFLRMTGFTRDEALGKTWQELTPEEFHRPSLRAVDEVMSRGETTPYEKQYLRKDGSRWWGLFAARRVGDEVVEFVLDVTERREAEAALRDSEERFRLAAEGGMLGTFEWNVAAGIIAFSPAAQRIFGFETPTVPAEMAFGRVHPDDMAAVRAAAERALEPGAGADWRPRHRICLPDGSQRWVQAVASVRSVPGAGAAPRSVRMLGVVWDVTEHEQLVEDLREADRRKDEFLAMLAHELRNPLAPLTNVLRLIERTEPLTERGRSLLATAERQRAQLARLLDDLLEVSRITRGKIELRPEPMLVGSAVFNALESVGAQLERHGQRIELALPSTPVRIVADPARIAQVLENLLTNASKYTPDGGLIRVAVEQQGGEVLVRVSDNGIGIEPDQIPRLFELFQQLDATLDRAHGGLGIGLALVKRLVALHGGSVSAHSAGLGQGATFTIRLPCVPAEPREPAGR